MDRAVRSADPHAIKFIDTALDTHTRSRNASVLALADRSVEQITAD